MSRFVGGGSGSGYFSLFRVRDASTPSPGGYQWNFDNRSADFARRFGLARLNERNKNLLDVLDDPSKALNTVNDEIAKIAKDNAGRYQKYLDTFRNLGFGEDECVAKADVMVGRNLETELSLIQIKYPYATGGAEAGGWDPVSAILSQSQKARDLPRTFKAVGSSGGLGVKGSGISKKQRLKRKFKKRYSSK